MSSELSKTVRCPYKECPESSHPFGTEFCPNTGKSLKKGNKRTIILLGLAVFLIIIGASFIIATNYMITSHETPEEKKSERSEKYRKDDQSSEEVPSKKPREEEEFVEGKIPTTITPDKAS